MSKHNSLHNLRCDGYMCMATEKKKMYEDTVLTTESVKIYVLDIISYSYYFCCYFFVGKQFKTSSSTV